MIDDVEAVATKAKKSTWITTPDLLRMAERLTGEIVDQVAALLADMSPEDAGTNAEGACARAQHVLVGIFATLRELRAETTEGAFTILESGFKRLDEIARNCPAPKVPGRPALYAVTPDGLAVHPWVGPPLPGVHCDRRMVVGDSLADVREMLQQALGRKH